MNRKIKILVTGLAIVSFFLTTTPLINFAAAVDEPDLIVHNIDVYHWDQNTKHTVTITIKNIGDYPVSEEFKLTLLFEIDDLENGDSVQPIKEWTINGIGETYPWNTKVKIYTHTWDNPDPQRYRARYCVTVDTDNDVDESNEDNNEGCSEWFN